MSVSNAPHGHPSAWSTISGGGNGGGGPPADYIGHGRRQRLREMVHVTADEGRLGYAVKGMSLCCLGGLR